MSFTIKIPLSPHFRHHPIFSSIVHVKHDAFGVSNSPHLGQIDLRVLTKHSKHIFLATMCFSSLQFIHFIYMYKFFVFIFHFLFPEINAHQRNVMVDSFHSIVIRHFLVSARKHA